MPYQGTRVTLKVNELYVWAYKWSCVYPHGAVGMHVAAKRALVTLDEEYFSRLSKASVETLKQQGGPMSSDEVSDFLAIGPAAELAMRLRKYDELGKEPDLVVEGGLSRFRGLIYDHLRAMSQAVIDPS